MDTKLKKIIEYAVERGLDGKLIETFGDNKWIEIIIDNKAYFRFLFSHDFAKAVFQPSEMCARCKAWKSPVLVNVSSTLTKREV